MPSRTRVAKTLLWGAGLTLGVLWCSSNWAQVPIAPVEPEAPAASINREEAREMVSGLSDEALRKPLLEYLDRTVPDAQQAPSTQSLWLLNSRGKALTEIERLLAHRTDLGAEFRRLRDTVAEDLRHPWLGLMASVILCLLAGALLERFILRPRGTLGGVEALGHAPDGGPLNVSNVLLGATARSLGALVFLLSAVVALLLLPGLSEGGRALAGAVIWLVGGTRLFIAGINALLLPAGGPSPWPFSDAVGRTIARHLGIVVAFVLLALIIRNLLSELGAQGFFVMTIALVVTPAMIAAVLVAIFAIRRTIDADVPQPQGTGIVSLLHDRWHYLAATYVLAVYVFGIYARLVTGEPVWKRSLASLALVLVVPALDYAVRALAARLAPSPDEGSALAGAQDTQAANLSHAELIPGEPVAGDAGTSVPTPQGPEATDLQQAQLTLAADEARRTSVESGPPPFREALVVNFRILLALGLIKVMGLLWGIRIFDLVASLFGAKLTGALFQVFIASLFAFVVWRILKAALIANAPSGTIARSGGEAGGTGRTRAQTLMPLIANTVGATLIVMLTMITLSALGVNIAPLLASAGIVGLAIGFGAQTLVKDIVSGIFFLVDDAFRMGEYLQIGNIRGTVERIAVRSLRLRHHNGPMHTVPYGEVRHITNYSRDYAIMKFEIRVPFETDVEKVRKLIKHVGEELMENDEVAPVMLEPLKSQGVNRMDDSAFVIRCKFMTTPGKQFVVRRFAYAMIQEAFEAEGIKFAPKRVIVETTAPPGSKEALAAAAAAAQEDEAPVSRAR